MSITRSLSASLILSTALVAGACKGKDRAEIAESGPVKALKTEKISNSEVDGLFDIKSRKVPNAEAEEALKKLGLADDNRKGLIWDKRSGDNGKYTFNDVTIKDDDGTVTIGQVKLSGVRMEGEDATFDLMTAENLKAVGDDGTIEIEDISIADPSPAMAAAMTDAVEQMRRVKDLDDIDLDIDGENIHFGAMSLKGITMKGDEANGRLDSLVWGENDKNGEAMFRLENLSIEGQSDKNPDMKFNIALGAINAAGINVDYYRTMSGKKTNWQGRKNPLGQVMNSTTPFTKTFDTVSFSDFNFDIDGLHVHTDGGQGKSTERGNVITTKQVLEPLVIEFKTEPTERGMKEFKKSLTSLGYDKLVITSSQESELNAKTDTVTVRNSFFDVKDAFRMAFDYQAGGINAVTQGVLNAQQSGEDLSDRDMERLMDSLELQSFNLAMTDKSIVDRGFKFAAEQQGSSPKVLRMQAKSMLMMLGLGVKNEAQGAMVSELSSAVGDFIDDGGTLKLGLKPSKPLTVKQLRKLDTGDLGVDALGFYAKTD